MKTNIKLLWIEAVLFGILSLACFFFPAASASLFFDCVALICACSALALWYKAIKSKKGISFAAAAAATLLSVLFWMHRLVGYELIVILFSIYMAFNAICEGIQFVLDLKEKASNTWFHGMQTFLYAALCIFSLAEKSRDLKLIFAYFGLYLLIQFIQCLVQIFFIKHPSSSRSLSLRHWVSLPVYIVSFLPGLYLRELLKNQKQDGSAKFDEHKNDKPVNLRVFIHSGLGGEHLIGHMTFAYKDKMYSYGNYDIENEKFFRTVGPGILFTVDADLYANNSCIYEKSILFEYGLHLDEAQENKLEEVLAKQMENTYPWLPQLERAGATKENFKKYESDYASRLWYRTNADFYKFKDGQWKNYWVLGDNCSLFSESILSSIGCDIAHKNGIVSPGEYFEFFEDAYMDPDSNVVYKSWHDANVPDTLFKNCHPVREA